MKQYFRFDPRSSILDPQSSRLRALALGFGLIGGVTFKLPWATTGQYFSKTKSGLLSRSWQAMQLPGAAGVGYCPLTGLAACAAPAPWQASHCTLANCGV